MIDFDGLALGPVYDAFGERAVLDLGSISHDLVVINHTTGIAVEDGSIGVQTIRPAVDVRRSALTAHGIAVADLLDGRIVLGSTAWRIKTVIESGLELRLVVMQDD